MAKTGTVDLAEKPLSYFIDKAGLNLDDSQVNTVVEHYFSSAHSVPNWQDLSTMARMFSELSEHIYTSNASQRKYLHSYLENHGLLDDEKVIVVDVGWLLNVQSRLARFIKEQGATTQLIGSYVGSRDRINKRLAHSSLLFDNGDPSAYAAFLEEHVTLFEVLFSAPEPSAQCLAIDEQSNPQVKFKPIGIPVSSEFLAAQKIQLGAEIYFGYLADARRDFFPEQISRDYFFELFKALANTDNDLVRAALGHFEVRLGGQHEFLTYQRLVNHNSPYKYTLKKKSEYFSPLDFGHQGSSGLVVIITSAGLDNGSTRYRSIHLAEALQHQGIAAVLIHSATPLDQAESVIGYANTIIFQRCFEEQGNVGNYLSFARTQGKRCIADIDDLVFPEFIATVGSVKGGEWGEEQALFVASSYEKLIQKLDACIVSTPLIGDYVKSRYALPSCVVRNKITPKWLRAPACVSAHPLRLIYASGTYSHKQDFELIENELYKFLHTNPSVTLSVLGATQVGERILALPNVANYPLLPYSSMLGFIAKHNLMLVPLVDDHFNRAKSSVKFVESGAVGVPVLASNVGEFAHAIRHHHNGLLANSALEWAELLRWAVKQPESLAKIAQEAYETVKDNFTTLHFESRNTEFLWGHDLNGQHAQQGVEIPRHIRDNRSTLMT